jgi:hypothetical protein
MHPRLEARTAAIARHRLESVLAQLDGVIEHLSRLQRFGDFEPLIVRYRTLRALIAEGNGSSQKMQIIEATIAAELTHVCDAILWPFLSELIKVGRKDPGFTASTDCSGSV